MPAEVTIQIGKNGLSEGFFQTLDLMFKKHNMVKVSVLRSAKERENIKELAQTIKKRLGGFYDYRAIGFTIVLKKFKKKVW